MVLLLSVSSATTTSLYTINNYVLGVCQHYLCVFHIAATTVSVVLVSVLIVSVISTAIITSIIVWCVMRRRPSSHAKATSDASKKHLTPAIYDTPNAVNEHTIATQDNVAYGGTIPLKHNEAYQQVNIK